MTLTKIERIANYATRAKFEDLSDESKKQIPVHILDSLGCQIAALGAGPVNACHDQVREFSPSGIAPLIAGGTSNPVFAAFWHTALVRYVDAMDNILAPKETAHTADNFGGILTAASIANSSGKDLMLGVAIGWTIQTLLVEKANFMTRGFDHTAQLAFSVTAASGKLLGLDSETIANAIAMAASSDASFAGIRSKPLSEWKGLASAQSTLGAFNALYLAKRGVEGPLAIVEEPQGIEHLLGQPIDIDWEHENYEGVPQSTIKKFVAMIHTQSAIECILELLAKTPIQSENIKSIEADVPQITYDFSGGGLYGNADAAITTKEQADHSLPYLLAVAVLDGQVMQPQFEESRIIKPDVQTLLQKVIVKPDADFTKRYPKDFCARITITQMDGTVTTHEVSNYPGMPCRPFTWEDSVDKFDRLTKGYIDPVLAEKLKEIVKDIENRSTKDLFDILTKIKYPTTNK
ncbi:MmgE/PrpD family protein [Vagococcus bubulae]|uniref:2-methylcitrate dehydratase n=1 Tax=Vagococcus bubulae TaxID=1977868 RepID=A0A429ZN22_9ENTE|nr:MmgE/PrpD family protein [Vagococcus bubulae]RST95049.1 2-methylcitrate dehydratase [Vagococcus bubulae]